MQLEPLNAQDIQNILNIMSRVELKGNEAHAYVTCDTKLRVLMKQLEEAAPATDEDTDGGGDTQG